MQARRKKGAVRYSVATYKLSICWLERISLYHEVAAQCIWYAIYTGHIQTLVKGRTFVGRGRSGIMGKGFVIILTDQRLVQRALAMLKLWGKLRKSHHNNLILWFIFCNSMSVFVSMVEQESTTGGKYFWGNRVYRM